MAQPLSVLVPSTTPTESDQRKPSLGSTTLSPVCSSKSQQPFVFSAVQSSSDITTYQLSSASTLAQASPGPTTSLQSHVTSTPKAPSASFSYCDLLNEAQSQDSVEVVDLNVQCTSKYVRHFCPHCDYTTPNIRKLQGHIILIHPPKFHTCPECSLTFVRHNSLKVHINRKHKNNSSTPVAMHIPDILMSANEPKPAHIDIDTLPMPEKQDYSKLQLIVNSYLRHVSMKNVPEATFVCILDDILRIEPSLANSCNVVSTPKAFDRYVTEHMGYIAPEIIQVNDSGHLIYVPITQNIESLLKSSNITLGLDIMDPYIQSNFSNGLYSDFFHGSYFRNIIDNSPSNTLFISLYVDDFGAAPNPLRPSSLEHTTFSMYMSLLNLHPSQRNKPLNHSLVVLCKSRLMKVCRMEEVLKKPLEDMLQLERSGIRVNSQLYSVRFVLCTGDNLGLHEIGGFSKGFNTHRPCRFCMISKRLMQSVISAGSFVYRTVEGHRSHLLKIADNPNISSLYGVFRTSPLSPLLHFEPVLSLPPDIMHDIFEGFAPVILTKLLDHLHSSHTITWTQIGLLASNFAYSGSDKANKLTSLNFPKKVKGKAAQIMCLVRLFGLLFGEYFSVGDSKWAVWQMMKQLSDFALAVRLTQQDLIEFQSVCESFVQHSISQFTGINVTPKMHYILHYPKLVRQYGPLSFYSSMCHEALHFVNKKCAATCGNFKNVQFTMARKYQLKAVYLRNMPNVLDTMLNVKEESLSNFLKTNSLPEGHPFVIESPIFVADSLNADSVQYKRGLLVVVTIQDQFPVFSRILNILKQRSIHYLHCQRLQTCDFDKHRQSFVLSETSEVIVLTPTELLDHKPIAPYTICGQLLAVGKYRYNVSFYSKIYLFERI